MVGGKRVVQVRSKERRLVVVDCGRSVASFPVATARYDAVPKYWSNDYRNASGIYDIAGVFTRGTNELDRLNAHSVPWYLSGKAANPYEDAGLDLYGDAMIVTSYPNQADLDRYERARRTGLLRRVWNRFCEKHLRPIYERIARQSGLPFDEVRVATDYGNRTFADALESCPVLELKVAFDLGVTIHGTNDPGCIGTPISAGCIRMHNSDIAKLLSFIDAETKVAFETPEFFSV